MITDGRDESWSEITIRPDGQVYVFGLTRPLLGVLANIPAVEDEWRKRLELATDEPTNPIEERAAPETSG
jgi:hypothetical protein